MINLQFIDLSARLFYSPYIDWGDGDVSKLGPICYEMIAKAYFQPEGRIVKLFLRDLSDMTEDEKKELSEITGCDCLDIEYSQFEWTVGGSVDYDTFSMDFNTITKIIDFFNSHHLDFRGLIKKGLATRAPDGMYK